MIAVEAYDSEQLLKITWSDVVPVDEMRESVEQLRISAADMRPGFRLLADFSGLISMDPGGASYIAASMDLLATKQVGFIVRVIPDPSKDIGFNILSRFHYPSEVQIVTDQTLAEAWQRLSGSGKSSK